MGVVPQTALLSTVNRYVFPSIAAETPGEAGLPQQWKPLCMSHVSWYWVPTTKPEMTWLIVGATLGPLFNSAHPPGLPAPKPPVPVWQKLPSVFAVTQPLQSVVNVPLVTRLPAEMGRSSAKKDRKPTSRNRIIRSSVAREYLINETRSQSRTPETALCNTISPLGQSLIESIK